MPSLAAIDFITSSLSVRITGSFSSFGIVKIVSANGVFVEFLSSSSSAPR
jgi:hypothetical protein